MLQSEALSILRTGENVFLTGEPGSGKTYTLNRYIEYLREHKIEPAITASTGIAATHLGGTTIHSWSGIGIKKELSQKDIEKLRTKKYLVSRLQNTSVLIIDEVSMLEAKILDCVNLVLKEIRKIDKPFGGMQVIFTGDFFQLPPVFSNNDKQLNIDNNSHSQFAFESEAWNEAQPVVCYLSEQYRQEDASFLSVLKSIRRKDITETIYNSLSDRMMYSPSPNEEIDHTRLYSHNMDVDRINYKKLASLPGDEYSYQMTSNGKKALVDQLIKGCLSPEILRLKKDARVIFTKNNFEQGFVNGTIGVVVDFTDENLPIVQTLSGREITVKPMEWTIVEGDKVLANITQFPLRLAWAITVHKSQGMTLDSAIVDLSKAFEYGQGYVAISRVRSFSGLYLLGYNERALEVHPVVFENDDVFQQLSDLARNNLEEISEVELFEKHKKFILRCGGDIEKTKAKSKKKRNKSDTYDITLALINEGKNIKGIAEERGLKEETILRHIEKLFDEGKISDKQVKKFIPTNLNGSISLIKKAFQELGTEYLSPVYKEFNGEYSYNNLRLIRLLS